MRKQSTEQQPDGVGPLLPSRVSRRAFLAGAAACAAVGPTLLADAIRTQDGQILLHVAVRNSRDGYVHTYVVTFGSCMLLGSIAVESFAALAAHPLLPVLYVARDCREWKHLPRGVIDSYAVEHGMRPLRLFAQTPMALSATGPRSLAVSSCGRYLLVSASTGGAWNGFALDRDGVPAVAIARKEMGAVLKSDIVSLPTPHGVAFSPHGPFALGTDPGSGRMTLLQPSPEQIAVLARCQTPYGLTASPPVWTSDGRYVVVANARRASLSIYEMAAASEEESHASFHLVDTIPTASPVTTLLAHAQESAVFTSRTERGGSRLELWEINRSHLRLANDRWVSGDVAALAQHAGGLWIASHNRLIRISIEDLRSSYPFEVSLPMHGAQALVAQNVPPYHLDNV